MATLATHSASWRKRSLEDDPLGLKDLKKPRLNYYRLASESSRDSEEDTESVNSIQDRETDVIQDTPDTRTDCSSNDEYEVEIEYEVASLSEEDNDNNDSSTGSEDMMMAAAAVAAVICDTSYEGTGLTDSEDSDNSSIDTSITRSFSTCIQCKFENNNPLYRYCEKCFQSCRQCKMRKTYKCFPLCNSCYKDRKKYFPPRPRGFRKKKKVTKVREPPVKLDTLAKCLSGLSQMSQDSGIGSSQECPQLDLDRIVVPEKHLTTQGTATLQRNSSVEETAQVSSTELTSIEIRNGSTSSFDSGVETKPSDVGSEIGSQADLASSKSDIEERIKQNENSDLCMFCNSAPKDSIFLHTNIAHMCCCYKCAKKTLNTIKRCPICNRAVNKVIKVFSV